MTRYTFDRPAHAQGLRDELLAASIPVALVMPEVDDPARTVVDVPDADYDATAAIVAAHDPSVYTAKEHTAKTAYDAAIQFLQTFSKQTPGTATAAQQDRAIGALITVAKAQNADLRELQGGGG